MGDQTPIGVSDAVRAAMVDIEKDLPPGIEWTINRDRSDIYRQRLTLLLKNAFYGLTLVLLLLGLTLELRLAFWVTMGIPISFLGCFLFMPYFDVTINMISMFAFIIALGIVVDDAIVVGENIHEYRLSGMSFMRAAIEGTREVLLPVTFSILTNIVAFLPLSFVPGVMGKIWRTIPFVVITVFAISWIEALLILPCHLAHGKRRKSKPRGLIAGLQGAFTRGLDWFINKLYAPFLDFCIRMRMVTIALSIAVFIVVLGYVKSGRIGLILMPRVESDRAVVTAVLPYGSPVSEAEAVLRKLLKAAEETAKASGGDKLVEGIFALIDENEVEVTVYLTDPGIRPISTTELTQLWRERTGPITGLESLRFEADRGGPGRGASLTVELSHRNIDVLDRASEALAERLADFANVKDIDDGFTPGKKQLDFSLTEEGHSLGLTQRTLARKLRNAFYGAEAVRQQRGRNEIRVKVRLPRAQRTRQYDLGASAHSNAARHRCPPVSDRRNRARPSLYGHHAPQRSPHRYCHGQCRAHVADQSGPSHPRGGSPAATGQGFPRPLLWLGGTPTGYGREHHELVPRLGPGAVRHLRPAGHSIWKLLPAVDRDDRHSVRCHRSRFGPHYHGLCPESVESHGRRGAIRRGRQ